MGKSRLSFPHLLVVRSLGSIIFSLFLAGCSNFSTSTGSGAPSPSIAPVPATYVTNPPHENVLQWKLDDDTGTAVVVGHSQLNGFAQNGELVGASTTTQVASTVQGFPAFHLQGQYVSIDLSTIHPYETANLWTKHSGNPIISNGYPQDCEIVRNPTGPNGGDWYCFGSVDGHMGRYESDDLIRWSGPIEVLQAGGPGAWDELVQNGYVFQDPLSGGVWDLLYRGYNTATGKYQVGLATSSDGTTFVKRSNGGVNDGLFSMFGDNYDVQAVMLIGTTYYVYVNGSPFHNSTNLYLSSDDFNTFISYEQNPIFVNAFCPTVWSNGGYYYMLISRDISNPSVEPLSHGIALYRSKSPTFDPTNRDYLGYAVVNDQPYDGRYLDSPSVPMTDVYRTTYPPEFGNVLYTLYSGVKSPPTSFAFTQSIAYTTFSALSSLAPIPESITESLSTRTPITYSFWVQFDALVAGENVFRVGGDNPADGAPTWFGRILRSGHNYVFALYFDGTDSLTSLPLSTNAAYLITVVDNVSDKRVYINGSLAGTFAQPMQTPYPNPTYLYIGAGDGTKAFDGFVWDFRIYQQGLSAAGVKDLYEVGSVAPRISNITASVTGSTATITWQTDNAADSQVAYGLSSTYTDNSSLIAVATTAHSVSLAGLSPSTTYHFAVKSSDGTLSTSADQTFTTLAAN